MIFLFVYSSMITPSMILRINVILQKPGKATYIRCETILLSEV